MCPAANESAEIKIVRYNRKMAAPGGEIEVPDGGGDQDSGSKDPRVQFVSRQVYNAFRGVKVEIFKRFINAAETVNKIHKFLDTSDVRYLLFRERAGHMSISTTPPKEFNGSYLYLLKVEGGPISMDNYVVEILVGDVNCDPVEHLAQMTHDIYLPLLSNPENQNGWTEMVSKDVMENLQSFVANLQITEGLTRGQTCLPLPSERVISDRSGHTKDRIHVLESALITWTKQIKNVLKQDPEILLTLDEHPGPLKELDFWNSKSANLNSIFEQLQGDKIRKVLRILDQSKSTYNAPFAKLCKEVFQARAEGNDNHRFLRPLRPWFERLDQEPVFENLTEVFRPMMHLVLLVWKGSRFYNTPPRLVVLMREICNSLIRQACSFVNGETIFTLIEAEDTRKAVDMLRTTLRVCGTFKSTYFDYKAKANAECPGNPWRIQNNALFVRLDAFLERCHDILDLTLTIMQFSKLAKIEVGGTKGKTLTTSLQQIYADFLGTVAVIRSVPYDIMNLDAKMFEDDFYEFRSRMKELERRLASVVTQGFDDCASVTGRFKLLDSFEGLLERPIIQDELEKKHTALLVSYSEDLTQVQQLFLEFRDDPPISHNLPPIAGALSWCRGLLERIRLPMDKLKALKSAMDREEAKEVVKAYTALVASLAEFEHHKIAAWGQSIEASSQAKLKNPLLRRDSDSPLLHVNFDPLLVRLLREVKYFLLLGLQVPDNALQIYRKAEVFRQQTGNLDLIVNMYNTIQTKLLPVERPLVKTQLDKIDKALAQGIGASGGRKLNWKSHGIDTFLNDSMSEVRDANTILATMKANLKRVEALLEEWGGTVLMERRTKPSSVEEYEEMAGTVRAAKYTSVREGGNEIHRLLKDTNKKLKVSQGLPDWKAYVDFVNNVVVSGLVSMVQASLRFLHDQIDPAVIAKDDKMPLLEIDLDLYGKEVMYVPSVTGVANKSGVRDTVYRWIDRFFHVACVFKRLDTNEGTYLKEMYGDPGIQMLLSRIHTHLVYTEEKCAEYRDLHINYAYLWTTDLNQLFADFLKDSFTDGPGDAEADRFLNAVANGENTSAAAAKSDEFLFRPLDLAKFEGRIQHFVGVQDSVGELKSSTDIVFLRVNAQPMKQALSTWVTKWVYLYTQFLSDHVVDNLMRLHNFMTRVNNGLGVNVVQGDKDALMGVMCNIRDVRKIMEQTQEMFQPLRDTVALLKTHNIPMDISMVGEMTSIEALESAPMLWDNTVNKAFKKKEIIQPLQNAMVDTIKRDIGTFNDKVSSFREEFKNDAPFELDGAADDAYPIIDQFMARIAEMVSESDRFHELEELFELSNAKYDKLEDSKKEIVLLKMTWDMNALVDGLFSSWNRTLWAEIDTESLLDETKLLNTQVRKLPKTVRDWPSYTSVDMQIKNMSVVLPLVHELHSPSLRDRHWKNLALVTHHHFEKGPLFCLEDLLGMELHLHVADVQEIVEMANRELKIESRVKSIEECWTGLPLEFKPYKDTDLMILVPPDVIVENLEEHQLLLQNMAGMGKFVDYFRDRVTQWQRRLGNVETTLKLWLHVQKQWASLEAIFLASADIRSQLPDDTKRFEGIDSEFKELMREALFAPVVIDACTRDGREAVLMAMAAELEKCQKALNEYLDMKKNIFPRFFFVSNLALLDILSNGNNPPKILPHLGSVFDAIDSLDLQDEAVANGGGAAEAEVEPSPGAAARPPPNTAIAMISKDGERVALMAPFLMHGAVENWLNELVFFMQGTLKNILDGAVETAASWEIDRPRHLWLNDYPAQLVLLASQVCWTEETENALEEFENGQEDAVKKYQSLCTERLESLIKLVQGELSPQHRTKIITLITIDVHSRDVVQMLMDKGCENALDFSWQTQLRYYWDEEKHDVNIRICDFRSLYSYEYIGNCGRLVITPLTDRCYVTLTTALRLFLGGAPAGPAGTGKTETTKDLARGMGLRCVVFNCSDQMNYQSMADIFRGLAQTGAWGCFDEFNRIPIEVLSVVATQVKAVLDAVVYLAVPANRDDEFASLPAGTPPAKVGHFDFLGESISLVPTTGFFITMNPGYAGRTELPENLKALFRSCAMIRPDLKPICENMLMAEGFVKARPLAIKFVTLYELSSELLSKQAHYDWGLRAVKSVLRVAGMLKRASSGLDEEPILMRALRDFNTPKIPVKDTPIFLRLISDLFPSMNLPTEVDKELRQKCIEVCQAAGTQPEDPLIAKVVQYNELLDVRHSVMLLGPPGAGKTTVWQTLAACINLGCAKQKAVYETVNPKSVTSDELYGFMTLGRDWKDGVLSIIMRKMSKAWPPYTESQSSKWVVLDGDIDAVWIESMNTVMDDNKVLTLVSNERIPLSDSMRMIFEISSLSNATPATVSRAGILYLNETDIGWGPYVESWIARRTNDKEKHHLPNLFTKYVVRLVELRKAAGWDTVVDIPVISMVSSTCQLLEGLLGSLDESKRTPDNIEVMFVFASMWAFGGALAKDRSSDFPKQFSAMFKSEFKFLKFPDAGLVFDYFYSFDTGDTVPWAESVPAWVSAGEQQFASIVVPTVELVRLSYLTDLLVKRGSPVLFVGSAGTGKTTLVRDFLRNMGEDFMSVTLNMNFYTDSRALQIQLEQPIDKRSGKTYGPPGRKKLIYFIDDLNMPFVEQYGTQTPIALLRQHMDYGNWFDRSDLGLRKEIQDVQFLACMNHKAGSFQINTRLQRHFTTFHVQMPSSDDLQLVYGSVLNAHVGAFVPAVQRASSRMVEATLALHTTVSERFLPSAIKFHYNFNMRDLASIFQGVCLSAHEYYSRPGKFVRLWLHECYRVFSDRLVTDNEIVRFHDMVVDVSKRYFEEDQGELHATPNIFTSFATPTIEDTPSYLPVADIGSLKDVLENKLKEYNDTHPIMDLVLFDEAMAHVTRIARIVNVPRGNALLVGVGGSGKQSLCRLASFICNMDVIQIQMTSSYGVLDLKEALKDLYRRAGVRPGLPLVFMLTDTQLVDERFLVYVNDLLSSGYIPDLFAKDEYDSIFSSLRNEARASGIPDTRDSMMEFFVERVRTNLHVVLCFSPVGDMFRVRARRFPGLINCTSIDWFHPWLRDALVSVAQRFLVDVELGTDEVKENVAHHMAEVHLSVTVASKQYLEQEKRYNYTTPKSFLELIGFYKSLLAQKRADLSVKVNRLDTGLRTLRRTNADVEQLQAELKESLERVDERRAATEDLLEEMGLQRGEAQAQQVIADEERVKATSAAEAARKIESVASLELEQAKPALDRAQDAVNCLNKASLTELKALAKPPAGVDKVTTAVLMMVKNEKRNFKWENAKKMMAKVDAFKTTLEEYRGEDIPPDVVERVEPIISDPNFTYDKMKTKSVAAANLCNWVINILTYNKIYVRVKPLMDSLEEARKTKDAAEADLEVVEAGLAKIQAQLQVLQQSFLEATNEKAKVEADAAACKDRLSLAERLVNGLSSENDRWGLEVDNLRTKNTMLVGDVLLSAAFVSYIGAFNAVFREKLWKELWLPDLMSREIPLTEEVDPLHVLSTDAKVAEWMNEGLPADRISFENGAIMTACQRWPLFIDPQTQGIKWLRRREEAKEDAKLVVLQMSTPKWMKEVERSIQNGSTVIIENVGETLDAVLNPVLSRAVYRKGRNLFLKLGGEEVEYDPNFRLYLVTKLSNPHYKPEISAQCTLINFIVTASGLEDQLLAKVVNVEQPELEQEKQQLAQNFNLYKIQLLDLENQLLERIANAPEDILSDVELIEGLEATKVKAVEINEAVARGKETETVLNLAREMYRGVAAEAAMLYFMLIRLCVIDHMYQFSLDSFVVFFYKSINLCEASDDQAKRVEALRMSLRFTVYQWVSRGLFEKHKTIFLTLLTFNLMSRGIIGQECGCTPQALNFLLKGPKEFEEDNPIEWLPDSCWNSLQALIKLEGFEKFVADLEESAPRFREWYNHVTPETEKLPLNWRELDKMPFLKLLVLRCMRPDRLIVAINSFLRNTLPQGSTYTECNSQLNSYQLIVQAFEDSTPNAPIYFILSPGVDVVADVEKLALKHGHLKGMDYHNISLGQGQDVVAMQKLEVASAEGHWVILNNVHLMPRWLLELEKKLDEYAVNGPHPNFRLFLSSDPSKTIPIGLLERSVKLTNEPPSGLKANLKRAFASFSKEQIEELEPRTRGILFGLSHFHAIMLERKKFGPMGFNMNYPFSPGDLLCSSSVLRNYMENAPTKVPWQDLRYLFGEIMYGGHIVNDFDRLMCNKYLEFFLRDELLDEMDLFPYGSGSGGGGGGGADDGSTEFTFNAPKISNSYDKILEHIDGELQGDTPLAFGLHPNAEIGFRTDQSETLLRTIVELNPRELEGGDGDKSSSHGAEAVLQDILEVYRGVTFDVDEVESGLEEVGPFQNVFLQETERTNVLIQEMVRSLSELEMGLRGDLTMSEPMEKLADSLSNDLVPSTWAVLAFPSLRPLGAWLADLQSRIQQLSDWMGNPSDIPIVTWISGLFNPQSFLTAIMQTTAQRHNFELNKLIIVTDVTKRLVEAIDAPSRDGAYIHGLSLEGARWDQAAGILENSEPREMFCPMPVINCRAVDVSKAEQANSFSCPVYKTQQRGPTYVFTANLRTKAPPAKWVLAGVVLIMDIV